LIEVSVIIPTYNERENIAELIERVEATLKGIPFELIIVDDNSPDGTSELAEYSDRKYGNIRVVRRVDRLGLGSAVAYGFGRAKAEIMVVMDADLQHPPELLSLMYKRIVEGHSLAIASRYVEGGGVEELSISRRLVSRGAGKLSHLLLPKTRSVKDPMSGFFMLRKEVINGVKLNPTGFKILLEILAKGKYDSVVEVPYTFKSRKRGKSKLNLREVLRYILLLFNLRANSGIASRLK